MKLVQWYISFDFGPPRNNFDTWGKEDRTYLNGQRRPILGKNITGRNMEIVELKQIGSSTPLPDNKNVFIFQYTGHSPGMFNNFDWQPLLQLPYQIINWLKKHPYVDIVYISTNECKPIFTDMRKEMLKFRNFVREYLDLENRFIFQNTGTKPELQNTQGYDDFMVLGGVSYIQSVVVSDKPRRKLVDSITQLHNPTAFTKKILNYNGRFRISRALLYLMLEKVMSKEDFLYSFEGLEGWQKEVGPEDSLYGLLEDNYLNAKQEDAVIDLLYKGPIKNTAPWPTKELRRNNMEFVHFPNIEDYSKVFCDVVSETYGDRDYGTTVVKAKEVMVTEKIMKPILAERPFMVQANAGFLEHLKSLGFKTFDKYWDEGYDKDMVLVKNIHQIRAQVKIVNGMSYDDIYTMYKDMKPILQHNRELMIDYMYSDEVSHIRELYNKLQC